MLATELKVAILRKTLILEVSQLDNENKSENIMLNLMRAFFPIYCYRRFVLYHLS